MNFEVRPRISPELQAKFREMAEQLRSNLRTGEPYLEKLAEMGWTIALHAPFWIERRLIEQSGSSEAVDEWMLSFFSAEDGIELEKLFEELQESALVAPQAALMKETVESYQDSRYAICIPALCSLLEGSLARGISSEKTKQTSVAKLAGRAQETFMDESMTRHAFLSCQHFLSRVFGWSSFEEPEPSRINRHWVIHGRATREWGQLDALRLLNALHLMTFLLEPDPPEGEI